MCFFTNISSEISGGIISIISKITLKVNRMVIYYSYNMNDHTKAFLINRRPSLGYGHFNSNVLSVCESSSS